MCVHGCVCGVILRKQDVTDCESATSHTSGRRGVALAAVGAGAGIARGSGRRSGRGYRGGDDRPAILGLAQRLGRSAHNHVHRHRKHQQHAHARESRRRVRWLERRWQLQQLQQQRRRRRYAVTIAMVRRRRRRRRCAGRRDSRRAEQAARWSDERSRPPAASAQRRQLGPGAVRCSSCALPERAEGHASLLAPPPMA